MKTIAFKWQTIGLLGFFALMTMGVFAQTAQPTDAHYVNPMTCNQLWKACERQQDMGIRPRACTMHATLCGWMQPSSSSANSCGPSAILCPPNRMPECSGGRWKCVMAGANCANTSVLCIEGTMPQCINDQWRCLPPNASSSTSSDRCIARCADGYEYRTCTEDGHPINYFVDPCFNHSSSSSSLPSATLCEENLCGPRPGMPNWICPDGNSYGGPTGRCVRHESGACGWEILSCPASSSTSSVSTSTSSVSSSTQSCYCGRIYRPVCGTNGQTYGNECEARCANIPVASEGRCGAASSISSVPYQCPVYSLMAPGPGCHYEYTKNERGCDVPNLVCASSSSSQMTCGPSNIRCRQGFEPSCSNGTWKCVRGTASSSSSACVMIDMAAPPPGCRYEGCRFDTRGCYQGGCRLTCSSSSVPAPSSCGPSTVLCAPNTNPVCSGGQWRCVPNSSSSSVSSRPTAQNGCKVAGCSSQLCVEEGSDSISTCEYREEYACYRTARCERQATGVCGWTQSQELRSCIANARS
jgi:Kazal-type serine protease inhibitor domain